MRWEVELSKLRFDQLAAGQTRIVVMKKPGGAEPVRVGDELLIHEIDVDRKIQWVKTGRVVLIDIAWVNQSLLGVANNYMIVELDTGGQEIKFK